MPRQKKTKSEEQEQVEENIADTQQGQQQILMMQQDDELAPAALRLQLLALSKEVLEHQSHLSWETHKIVIDVSIKDIIEGAREFLDFICEE